MPVLSRHAGRAESGFVPERPAQDLEPFDESGGPKSSRPVCSEAAAISGPGESSSPGRHRP